MAIYSHMSVKSSFLLVLRCHSDLIIATEAVHERKHFMANYIIKQDVWDGVGAKFDSNTNKWEEDVFFFINDGFC